ncbi:MAG: OmpA family protein [Kineosporiaceae bacterium]|nr:OmpA family protein [Kineosporiaceae bacterium]
MNEMTESEPRWRGRARQCLASAAVALMLTSTTASGAGADTVAIPVEGQTAVLGIRPSGTPLVLTVHAVRRLPGTTVLYYSAGFPPGADIGTDSPFLAASGSLGGTGSVFWDSNVGEKFCDAAAVDAVAGLVYGPLPDGVCSQNPLSSPDRWQLGKAYVFAVGLAPIPAGVQSVEVSIRGSVMLDVPVGDGPLEPLAPNGFAPVLGTAWPRVDPPPQATTADPRASIYPLHQEISNLEGSVTTDTNSVDLATDVLFAVDSATVTAAGRGAIAEAATALRDKGAAGTLAVVGHTDSDGTDAHNLELSRRRAEAVASILKPLLGQGVTLRTEGKGEKQPIADNDTPEGKQRNRRVTVSLTPGGPQ